MRISAISILLTRRYYTFLVGVFVMDFINQVSQLLRAELEELVDVARATMEPIELCDEEW